MPDLDPLVPALIGTMVGCRDQYLTPVQTCADAAEICRRQLAAELRAEQAEMARLGAKPSAVLAMGEAAAIVAGDRRHP